ncbi:hypothetical protein CHUAL_009743 [Chamberlinius hualienensis]
MITCRHVLTAAHCFQQEDLINFVRPEDVRAIVGVSDITTATKNDKYKIEEIHTHPLYGTPNACSNDITILVLSRKVDNVQPICLGNENMCQPGGVAVVAGWGKTRTIPFSQQLLQTQITIQHPQICTMKFLEQFNSRVALCAGTEIGGADACQGDSGGPLIVSDEGICYLLGIISYGDECGKAYTPAVYTKVPAFKSWIESIAKDVC